MPSIIQQIMQDKDGAGVFLEQLKNLTRRLDVETMRFDWDDGCEEDWGDVARQLSGTIFELVEHFGVDISNWPAWFMFELAQWINNEWDDTEQWLRDIHALAYLFSYGNTEFVDIDTPIHLLLASNVLCTAQEGWRVCLCCDEPWTILTEVRRAIDEPWTILTEVRRAIDDHYYGNYEHVLNELAEGRYDLRPVAETPPSPRPATPPPLAVSGPQSQLVRRKGAYTPAWSAPTVCAPPAADFPNSDRIAADVKKMLDAAELAYTVKAKVRGVVAIYEHLSKVVPDFVRAHPYFRITSLLKLIDIDDTDDRYKFKWVSDSPSYVELCDRALAAWSNTGISVPRGYRLVAFSCLRAETTFGVLGPLTPTEKATEKATRISMAVHLDRLEAHMVAFAPTLAELTLNGYRLRSGKFVHRPVLSIHDLKKCKMSVTHEVVVLVAPMTPPSSPPLPVLLDDDGGDGPTDPRSLVVYDDDYLDIEYAVPGAPAPSNSPSPRLEDYEEINYDSDSDGDVFDDCDSEDGWERVHHRDRMLGLIE